MRFLFRTVWLLGLVALGACEERNPESCAADNFCVDPDRPFCDIDGSVAGEPGKCVAVSCTASAFEKCRGDDALVCNEAGDDFNITNCVNGCDPEAGCRSCPANASDCLQITPKYLPTICSMPPMQSLVVSNSTTIDTDQMSNCTVVVPQLVGPEICVLRHDGIKIELSKTLTVTGKRALALVASHDLEIDGTLDVSANGIDSGPGGGILKSGSTDGGGGGGAGYRTPGGAGASSTIDGGAANGGAIEPSAAVVTDLLGGRSARPSSFSSINSVGGAGGALTLISCRGEVRIRGIVDAGGGGGRGERMGAVGVVDTTFPGGGGSGGTVALQGISIRIEGGVFANGGAGGGGGASFGLDGTGGPGAPGADGPRSTAAASPGLGGNLSGDGGAGGSLVPPTAGRKGQTGYGLGAGGGSAGYILFLTGGTTPIVALNATLSPPAEPSITVATTR